MSTVIIGNQSYSAERAKRLRLAAPTLSQALDRYVKEVSPTKRSDRNTDITLQRAWNATSLANKPISMITQKDLVKYRDSWLKEMAPATVVRRLALVSHLYTIAIKDWGMLYITDPSKSLRRPIVQNSRERRIIDNVYLPQTSLDLPRDEIGWITKHTKSPYLPTIIQLALETAMRRSEIVNMRREHIDFNEGCILIPTTKNGRARKVPLSPWAKYVLIQYIMMNNHVGRIFDITDSSVTKSFTRAVGKAREVYESVCINGGVEPNPHFLSNLRFHDLRHEATSRLATVYEMHELAKVTGHADTRMIIRYYHPDVKQLTMKLANSPIGQNQFNKINEHLLHQIR